MKRSESLQPDHHAPSSLLQSSQPHHHGNSSYHSNHTSPGYYSHSSSSSTRRYHHDNNHQRLLTAGSHPRQQGASTTSVPSIITKRKSHLLSLAPAYDTFTPYYRSPLSSKSSPPPHHVHISIKNLHRYMLLTLILILGCYSDACYVYPPDVKDPCTDKHCSFGAQCVASLDGLAARCQCPDRCDKYGDSVGSRPVCGSDGKDYQNDCEMKRAACRNMKEIGIKYYGRCGEYCFFVSI